MPASNQYWVCPNCKKNLGPQIPNYCPDCGENIAKAIGGLPDLPSARWNRCERIPEMCECIETGPDLPTGAGSTKEDS